MGRTVRELLDSIDAEELQEWIGHYETDPWDEQRADLRAGVIASVIANVNSRKRRFSPSDFVSRYRARKQKGQTDLRGMAERWNAVLGGDVVKG